MKQITNDEKPESSLTFSPDGKKIYFLRAGRLWSMNLDGSEQKEEFVALCDSLPDLDMVSVLVRKLGKLASCQHPVCDAFPSGSNRNRSGVDACDWSREIRNRAVFSVVNHCGG